MRGPLQRDGQDRAGAIAAVLAGRCAAAVGEVRIADRFGRINATGIGLPDSSIASGTGAPSPSNTRPASSIMHAMAKQAVDFVAAQKSLPKGLAGELSFIGTDNIANRSSIDNLQTMSKEKLFLFHGCALGPPTLAQTDSIKKQKSSDKDEFRQFAPKRFSDAAGSGDGGLLFPDAAHDRLPPPASEPSTFDIRSCLRRHRNHWN